MLKSAKKQKIWSELCDQASQRRRSGDMTAESMRITHATNRKHHYILSTVITTQTTNPVPPPHCLYAQDMVLTK